MSEWDVVESVSKTFGVDSDTVKYRYSTVSPMKHRLDIRYDTTDIHYPGFHKRRNILAIKGSGIERQIYCKCGWKSAIWTHSNRLLQGVWGTHMLEAERQGSLW